MNLIKINKKYSDNQIIYLDKNTYKIFKKLAKDIKKYYHVNLIITKGYLTPFIIKITHLSNYYHSGKAFNLLLNNQEVSNYINDNLTKYGLIKENNYFYYVGNAAYIINKYHLTLEGYIKMFEF